MSNTTIQDIKDSFESLPQIKVVIPNDLLEQWINDCIGLYELEIGSLGYDSSIKEFSSILPQYKIKTIALMSYCEFLTRELNRIEKINGIIGKDIQMTGADASKRVTMEDLKLQLERAEKMLHKQKQHCFV